MAMWDFILEQIAEHTTAADPKLPIKTLFVNVAAADTHALQQELVDAQSSGRLLFHASPHPNSPGSVSLP